MFWLSAFFFTLGVWISRDPGREFTLRDLIDTALWTLLFACGSMFAAIGVMYLLAIVRGWVMKPILEFYIPANILSFAALISSTLVPLIAGLTVSAKMQGRLRVILPPFRLHRELGEPRLEVVEYDLNVELAKRVKQLEERLKELEREREKFKPVRIPRKISSRPEIHATDRIIRIRKRKPLELRVIEEEED